MNRESIKDMMGLFLVLFAALLPRVYNLLYFHDLDTDEAVYTQAVFALTKGYLPYKEVFLAHPPVYFYLAFPIILISPTIQAVRLLNVVLSLGTTCTIFYLCKLWYSKRAAIIASMIYAFYPFAIYSAKLGLIENAMNLFIGIAICLFAKYFSENRITYLIISGFFVGISLMTKYTSLLILMVMILFSILRMEKRKDLLFFITGLFVFPLAILISLLITGTWSYFYTQTIHWQSIRFGMHPSEKLWNLTQGLGILSPLFLAATLRMIHDLGAHAHDGNDELMVYWFFVSLMAVPFQKIVFIQHFIPLVVPLCVLGAGTFDHYILNKSMSHNLLHWKISFKSIWRKSIMFMIAFIILFNFWSLMKLSYGSDWFMIESCFINEHHKSLLESRIAVGNYIKNITSPNDEIWTTDAAIAFLSQRIIVTTRSDYWKFQGFFQDVWGYGWTKDDYRGPIKDHPTGLINLHDISSAWEEKKPKVIVIIRTSWVDYFIWHGINNPYHFEEGLADYIKPNYHLGPTFYPLNIEVWVKN